jgi:hypothetical protein
MARALQANADGTADIAVVDSKRLVYLFTNNTTGGYTPAKLFTLGGVASGLLSGDYNSDGKPDLVAPSSASQVLSTLSNRLSYATGVGLHGSGTAGCSGPLGLDTNAAPKINTADFRIFATNAPPASVGLGLIFNAADAVGSDALGLGFLLHVDFLSTTELIPFDFYTDAAGYAQSLLAIPNNPSVVGLNYYAQGIWLWNGCMPGSAYQLSSSKYLQLQLQS